jgi:hypothetical protein
MTVLAAPRPDRIWRWEFPAAADTLEVDVPYGARLLHVAGWNGSISLWFEVTTTAAQTQRRRFALFGTGHELPANHMSYVGTALNPPFAWHVYEVFG